MSDVCNPDNCSTIGVLQLKVDGLMQTIESQKETNIALASKVMDDHKFTELGRLALTTRASVCGSSDFKKFPNRCENHCFNYPFCLKRAELLAEVVQ